MTGLDERWTEALLVFLLVRVETAAGGSSESKVFTGTLFLTRTRSLVIDVSAIDFSSGICAVRLCELTLCCLRLDDDDASFWRDTVSTFSVVDCLDTLRWSRALNNASSESESDALSVVSVVLLDDESAKRERKRVCPFCIDSELASTFCPFRLITLQLVCPYRYNGLHTIYAILNILHDTPLNFEIFAFTISKWLSLSLSRAYFELII